MIGSGPDPGAVLPRPRRRGASERASRRAVWIAVLSTILFFGGLGVAIVNAPNWPAVQRAFFNQAEFEAALPGLMGAFWMNVRVFLIAEALILVLALGIAVLRGLPGPVFFPIRVLATIYVDVFRAVPGVLVIYILGFGIPGLLIPGVPKDAFLWGVVGLTLVYTAYVSEVYRAGIESVHPSQEAAARSLGLSRLQALRYVVIPQAVRRVIPPLLNDFIGLQKDTVFVSFLGVVDVFRAAQIKQSAHFNFTPYLATAAIFLIVTIPLARLTDWLVARDRRRGGDA